MVGIDGGSASRPGMIIDLVLDKVVSVEEFKIMVETVLQNAGHNLRLMVQYHGSLRGGGR